MHTHEVPQCPPHTSPELPQSDGGGMERVFVPNVGLHQLLHYFRSLILAVEPVQRKGFECLRVGEEGGGGGGGLGGGLKQQRIKNGVYFG